MRIRSVVLIALASAALPGVSVAQDGSEYYVCTGVLNNVTYRVFAVGGAGLTAHVEVPGWGDYVLRKGTGGWLLPRKVQLPRSKWFSFSFLHSFMIK